MNTIKAFIDEWGTNGLKTQKDGNLDLFLSLFRYQREHVRLQIY